jgi:NADH-quinone oxidoreductase subunit N
VNDPVIANLLNSFTLMIPEIALVVVACAIFIGGTVVRCRHVWATVALAGLALAAVLTPLANSPADLPRDPYAAPLLGDALAHFLRWLALAGGAIFILFSWNELEDRQAADYHACLLIMLAGLSLTGAANDLVTLFLALELISIPTYVILYLPRHDPASQEAALKYFMLSILSSALLLFGFSYLYGLTGSTNLSVLTSTLAGVEGTAGVPLLAQVAVIMVVAGLGFRITAVPFHFYAPDVYQGTATVLAALLAFVPKVAGFAALLRVLGFVLPILPTAGTLPLIGTALSSQIPILLWFLAAVTMFLGNVLALLQTNLKRLFAYSSVAHAGYMLIGLAAAPYLRHAAGTQHTLGDAPDGIEALLYYLAAYGAMTVGAFAVMAYLHSPQRPVENVEDLAGLSRTHPWAAVLMTVFLFSLMGIPFTAGFNGKLFIFMGAIGVGDPIDPRIITLFRILAVLGVINAAIGAWYYLRLIAVMFLRNSLEPVSRPGTVPGFAAIVVCAVLTIGLSIPPASNWLLRAAQQASGQPTRIANTPNAPPVAQAAANP